MDAGVGRCHARPCSMLYGSLQEMALERRIIGEACGRDTPIVVLLHGFMGRADDLAPFAQSIGVPARFVFPEALVDLKPLRGRGWWAVDVDERQAQIAKGPRDMSRFVPEGLPAARAALADLLDALVRDLGPAPLVLGGFSQGAMLACDLALRTDREIAAFVQLSGARICAHEWAPLLAKRAGLRAFLSHGRSDHDLSFEAAERFKDDLVGAGWNVQWCPFDGGHEIPLVVLRALKKFLKEL